MYDLIIVGASAAATAAGIYAARRKLNFKIISKDFGGEVAISGEIKNYPGITETNGIDLAYKFKKHLEYYNVNLELGVEVREIVKAGNFFRVITEKKEDSAKTVIITSGVHPRELKIPGEAQFKNKGVSFCTICDGPLFGGKNVAIIGGGNSALESAIMMSSIASKVYVLTINPEMQGEKVLIEKLKSLPNVTLITNASTTEIFGEQTVRGLRYFDKTVQGVEPKELKVEGIFVHIGMLPNSAMVMGVDKNEFGEIKVNNRSETNVPGLLAAGDVTDTPYKQIAVACGQGVAAALAAVDYLNKLKS